MESTVTVKGQITLPKAIRNQLHLAAGDRVRFFSDSGGRVYLLPTLPITALKGILAHHAGEPVSAEEMKEAVAEAVSDEYEASLQS